MLIFSKTTRYLSDIWVNKTMIGVRCNRMLSTPRVWSRVQGCLLETNWSVISRIELNTTGIWPNLYPQRKRISWTPPLSLLPSPLLTIIFGRVAYLGSFSLRSAVTTAGNFTRIDSKPPSISRVMLSLSPSTSSLEVNVAWGQSSREATIWPVWLQSSSIAWGKEEHI